MSGSARTTLAAVVIVAAGAVMAWVAWDIGARRVLDVKVTGAFKHVDRIRLEAVVDAAMQPGFFAVDVDRVRNAALQLAWIKTVQVRRVWPNSLELDVREREALVRWGKHALIEPDGTMFRPRSAAGTQKLPELYGPDGSAARVLAAWRRLVPAVASLPGGEIVSVELGARGDWSVRLANGIELVTDREPGQGLLVRVAPSLGLILGERLADVQRIDMRYGHGFAVQWRRSAEQGNGAS